ncbi:MAG: tRNA dimethylallyltransferase [Eubacterium sp.]
MSNGIFCYIVKTSVCRHKRRQSLRAERTANPRCLWMLKRTDSAANIHKNNRKRVIRALELAIGGTTKTEQNDNSRLADNPYDALYIGIGYKNRRTLYDRINRRVDIMIENGLVDEAKKMLSLTATTAKQAIGHKELSPYLSGEISLDDATENIKRATRRYAKRQLTWFRRNDKINWLYADEMTGDALIKTATAVTKEFLNK